MSINYIISSHPGKIESRKYQAISPYVLSLQLLVLKNIFINKKEKQIINYIGQITVVKTKAKSNEYYEEYYDTCVLDNLNGIPLRFVEYKGDNNDHSYDQWLQGAEAYPNFDYFLFIEDDYCIDQDNLLFDKQLIDNYNTKVYNNNGYLCSLTLDNPFCHAAISNGLIHKDVMNKISCNSYYDKENKFNYTNSYPQLRFSEMLLKNNIDIMDIADSYYTPFWDTTSRSIKDYSKSKNTEKSIIPIQCTYFYELSISEILSIKSILDKNLFNRV